MAKRPVAAIVDLTADSDEDASIILLSPAKIQKSSPAPRAGSSPKKSFVVGATPASMRV